MNVAEFLLARIEEDEHRLDCPPFVEEDSARGPGWGNRGDCRFCGKYQFSGYESVTEDAWWNHAEEAHGWSRVMAECAAKRKIVEHHQQWPVLVQGEPLIKNVGDDWDSVILRMTQQLDWVTQQEYVKRFGTEPPTAPILAAMARVYADHPDFSLLGISRT